MRDLSAFTTDSLWEELEGHLVDAHTALGIVRELRSRFDTQERPVEWHLPVSVSDRVRALFGPGDRTFKAILRRYRFAMRVWDGKYGPLNPEQAEYAESVILWALNVDPNHPNPRAAVYERLDRVVHYERVHQGFLSRASATVDITAQLAELAS